MEASPSASRFRDSVMKNFRLTHHENLFCRQDLTPTHPHKILNLSNILFVDKENNFGFFHSFLLLTIFDMHDEHHNIMNK
jgi:hypothetical protein